MKTTHVRAALMALGAVLLVSFAPVPDAKGQPCCEIVDIDYRRAEVTARDYRTGRFFVFRVNNRALIRALRVGEPVYPNYRTGWVSLDLRGGENCCRIVGR